jgi:hypothetical protein
VMFVAKVILSKKSKNIFLDSPPFPTYFSKLVYILLFDCRFLQNGNNSQGIDFESAPL